MAIKGVVPVMATPMHEDGCPDREGIKRLADFLIEKGVGGLWVLGTSSEEINMTRAHRIKTVRETARAVNGRIPVLTGTGANNVDEALEFIDEIKDVKISGVHFIYRDIKQSDQRMISNITRLADRSVFPIWLYNNVKRGKEISLDVIRTLKKHPNIHGVKYGSFHHGPFLKAVTEQDENFQVMCAGEFFFSMLCYGGQASTNSTANFCPEEYVKLYTLFQQGNLKAAREQQFRLLKLSSSLPKTDNGESSAEVKYALSLRGICSDNVNPSYRKYNEEEKTKARTVLREFGFSWASNNGVDLQCK